MLSLFGSHRLLKLLLLCSINLQCYSFLVHPSCTDLALVTQVLSSVENMVGLGAASETSWSKRELSPFYQTKIQQSLFANTAQVENTVALFRGATDIPWTIYTKDGSKTHPHPVIFACGASYLEAREGSDGVIRGYDEFTNTYEPLDAELEACNTIGPYQPAGANDPNTTFALQRAVTPVNDAQSEAPRRTVMRLCASALEDKQDDNAQIAIDLLDASKLAIAVAVNIKRNLKTMVRMRWTIDYFMGPDFYILMMVLEYAGGKPTEVTGKQWQQDLAIYGRHWAQCVAQKNADLLCQAYYGFALAFGFVDLYVNPAGVPEYVQEDWE